MDKCACHPPREARNHSYSVYSGDRREHFDDDRAGLDRQILSSLATVSGKFGPRRGHQRTQHSPRRSVGRFGQTGVLASCSAHSDRVSRKQDGCLSALKADTNHH